MVTKSSTISGANLFLSGVTILPATENTRSDLEEAAGMGKTTLTRSANLGRAFEEKTRKGEMKGDSSSKLKSRFHKIGFQMSRFNLGYS